MMNWKINAISALLGALCVFAFAPFEFYPVSFLSLFGLLFLIRNTAVKSAITIGFSFGLGLYLAGVSWVYVSLATYGGMPLWMGSIAVLGFASLLAVFPALACGLSSYLANSNERRLLLIFPFIWVITEWCKSWVLTGFPWLDIGYTQTPSWLFAWAPVGGIYLVSFAVLMLVALILYAYSARSITCSVGLLILLICSFTLQQKQWVTPVGKPLNVAVVQGNIPIESKWSDSALQPTLSLYRELSEQLVKEHGAELIVWPETALPLYVSQTDANFWQSISPAGSAVLAGMLDHDDDNGYNAAALSCVAGSAEERETLQVYRKRHLVPFGEYQPLKWLFGWVLEYLNLPMSDFAGWSSHQSLNCGDRIRIGLSICYEDAFSNEYRRFLGDATMLVNISEDAWFGDSLAPHQRTQFAQMRARELGRPMVRSANSGPSLFIDHNGKVLDTTDQFVVAAKSHAIQATTGETPFSRFGSWIVWLSLSVLLVSAVSRVVKK